MSAPDLIKSGAVAELLGVSRSHLRNFLRHLPTFPRPIQYTPHGHKYWHRAEILNWYEKNEREECGMTRPEKTYPITLSQIEDLADAICELDGAKHFFMAEAPDIGELVCKAHDALQAALGTDVHLVYGADDPETRPA